MVLYLSMSRPVQIKILSISKDLEKIFDLLKSQEKENIYKIILDLEYCLDFLKELSMDRNLRILLNKFEKEFKMMKIELFLRNGVEYASEWVLTWANILQHRAKLA